MPKMKNNKIVISIIIIAFIILLVVIYLKRNFLRREIQTKENNIINNDGVFGQVTDNNIGITNSYAQNGNIVIQSGNNFYTYKLEANAFFVWVGVEVNNIDLENNLVTYTNPQSNMQESETLENWVITDIQNGLGNSTIYMGETANGNEIRLTKIN